MAAIYGLLATSPGLDLQASASSVQARLAYLAPDGFTAWQAQGCVIGHGALDVGPRTGHPTQPLRLRDGRICVSDGYVANFDELRRTLCPSGPLPDDAGLLALAVERWGCDFTDHVEGEFVLALWDPAARVLELVRDRLGARPVCYVQARGLFAFASTALALAGLPGATTGLDPLGIVTLWYDHANYRDPGHTAFAGIHALAPGHRLTLASGQVPTVRRYWRMQPLEPLRLRDEGEYVEAFREAFGGAVSRAMRGSSGTALMLSGGIDSAAILAAQRGFRADGVAGDLLCISAVLAPGNTDPHAQAENRNILAMTTHHPRALQFPVPVPAAHDALVNSADLAEAAWSFAHPADISLLVPSLACHVARAEGCRLILNGVDGDTITSSSGVYYQSNLIREGQWRRAWYESVRAAQVNTYLRGQSPLRLFARAVAAGLEPGAVRGWRHRRRTERVIRGIAAHPEMAPALADRCGLAERLRRADALRGGASQQDRCDHLAHWLGFSLAGSQQIAARQGLETRHPWCDQRVLDFFLRLPAEWRTRDGWTKYLVRRACEPALGAEVVWHSGKHHLGTWLNRQALQEAGPWVRQMLVEQRVVLGEYYRDDVVRDALRQLNRAQELSPHVCDTLLTMTALAGWLRQANQTRAQG